MLVGEIKIGLDFNGYLVIWDWLLGGVMCGVEFVFIYFLC